MGKLGERLWKLKYKSYDYIESYPSDGEFNPNNCCGNRSMYETQGFNSSFIKTEK